MGKWSERIRGLFIAIGYVLIYCIVQVAVQMLYLAYYEAAGFSGESDAYERLLSGSFAISVISAILSFWIYLLIGYLRKKPVGKCINNRKCIPMEMIMTICVAIGGRLIVSAYYHFALGIDVLKQSIDNAQELAPESVTTYEALIAVFAAIVIAPMFEEFLFRGLIMGELMEFMRPWAAITLQAVLFGVAHMSLFQSLFAGIMGIILGIIYYKLKSIKAAVVCHGVFNYSAVIAAMELNNKSALIMAVFGIMLIITAMIYILKS